MEKNIANDCFHDFIFQKSPFNNALSQLGLYAYDPESQHILCNELWRSWGYNEADLGSQRLMEICHPDDSETVRRFMESLHSGSPGVSQEEFRIHAADGRWIWVRHSGTSVRCSKTGEISFYVGLDTDVSGFKVTEEKLRLLTEQSELHAREMTTLLNAATVITASLDEKEAVKLILEQAKFVIPYDKASVQIIQNGGLEIIGGLGFENLDTVLGLHFPYPEKGSLSTQAIDERRVVICKDVTIDFPGFIMAERYKPTRSWIGIPLIAHGAVFGLLSFNHSQADFYTERHAQLASGFAVHVAVALENAKLYESTRKLAMEDALMGIGSRHLFNIQSPLLYESARRKKTALSIAIVDLDHFKTINDTYGHDIGDLVLKAVGQLCRQDHRATDLIARYGGEEIVFLFPETEVEMAVRLADRLRRLISETTIDPVTRPITVSTGIATEIPGQGGSLSNLLKRADSALFMAKKNGRNRIEVSTRP